MSEKRKQKLANEGVSEPPKEGSCYCSSIAKCYKKCQPKILDETKVAFKNENEIHTFSAERKLR